MHHASTTKTHRRTPFDHDCTPTRCYHRGSLTPGDRAVALRITRVKTFIVDGGFRPWTFVKIETSDDGLVGWGDCTDWGSPGPIAAMVERLGELIVGQDPMRAERIWWDLHAQ